jgi:hypothetical protein
LTVFNYFSDVKFNSMTDLDSLKWGALLSSSSIAFGWLLNQFGQWWRFRKDDKRTLKVVLYNLLEVHYLLSRFDIDEPANFITDNIFAQLSPDQNTPENKLIMRNFMLREMTHFFDKNTINELKNLEEKYQQSITDLSKIDPIKAFYLSDKTKIFDKLKLVEGWVDSVYERHPSEDNLQESTKTEMTAISRPNVMDDSLKDLRKEMISISWNINPIIWLRVKHILNKSNYENTTVWEGRANEIILKILEHIKSQDANKG